LKNRPSGKDIGVRRRDFITLLGGTAAAWSLTLGAQGDAKIRRIGILANEKWPPIDGLRDGLRGLGYVEGLNLDLEYRYVEGEAGRYATFAAELVRLPVEVIVTWGTPAPRSLSVSFQGSPTRAETSLGSLLKPQSSKESDLNSLPN
jgi:hypothetical protein